MRLVRLSFTALMMMAVGCSCEDETVIPIQIVTSARVWGLERSATGRAFVSVAQRRGLLRRSALQRERKCSPSRTAAAAMKTARRRGSFASRGRARCLRPL